MLDLPAHHSTLGNLETIHSSSPQLGSLSVDEPGSLTCLHERAIQQYDRHSFTALTHSTHSLDLRPFLAILYLLRTMKSHALFAISWPSSSQFLCSTHSTPLLDLPSCRGSQSYFSYLDDRLLHFSRFIEWSCIIFVLNYRLWVSYREDIYSPRCIPSPWGSMQLPIDEPPTSIQPQVWAFPYASFRDSTI
jgi:hypothetical protein